MEQTQSPRVAIMKIDYLLVLTSGILFVVALPNFNVWPLAWIALVPLLFALRGKGMGQSFLLGFLFGFVAYLGSLFWLVAALVHMTGSYPLASVVWILATIYPALSVGIFCVLYRFVTDKLLVSGQVATRVLLVLAVPAIWVSLEFLQFHLFKGFPWVYYFMGVSQWSDAYILQLASFAGEIGISFLVVLVNYCLYRLLATRGFTEALVGGIALVSCVAYGAWVLHVLAPVADRAAQHSLKVVVLDGNIDSLIKWEDKEKIGNYIAQTYLDLNTKAVAEDPDLIVWTETAIPWPMAEGDDLMEAVLSITEPAQAYHVVGTPSLGPNGEQYNSVFFITPDGRVTDKTDKVNLLDFIESSKKFGPALSVRIDGARANYVSGTKHQPLQTPLGGIGVALCNENLYQDYMRSFAEQGAKFLLMLSNDSLLAADMVIRNHFAKNAFRAVESRRDVVVASNSGISGLVDAYGRVRVASWEKHSHIIPMTLVLREGTSFYVRFGEVFLYGCVAFAVFCVFYAFYARKGR